MHISLIGSLILAFSGGWSDRPGSVPDINLSAIRAISCFEGSGSGFMINGDTVVTAYHIGGLTGCVDVASGNRLRLNYKDEHRDFAMMKGILPDIPPLKVDCNGYEKGRTYYAYGHSAYGQNQRIFRQNTVVPTGYYSDASFIVGGVIKGGLTGAYPMPGMAHMNGFTVPGMSGGYIGTDNGYAVGIVTAGQSTPWGSLTGSMYSYELKNTILCKPAQSPAKSAL